MKHSGTIVSGSRVIFIGEDYQTVGATVNVTLFPAVQEVDIDNLLDPVQAFIAEKLAEYFMNLEKRTQ